MSSIRKLAVAMESKLIHSVPGIKILATSREALKITGEKVWRIPSLTLVDQGEDVTPEIAMNSEAVKLFCNRAGLINPDFELSEGNVGDVIKIERKEVKTNAKKKKRINGKKSK